MIEGRDVYLFYSLLKEQYKDHVGYAVVAAAYDDMSPRFQKGLMMLLLGFLPDLIMSECQITYEQYAIVLAKYQHYCGTYYFVSYMLLSVREHPDYFKHVLASAAVSSSRGRMADALMYLEALRKGGFRSEYTLPDRAGGGKAQKKDAQESPPPPVPGESAGDIAVRKAQDFLNRLSGTQKDILGKAISENPQYVQASLFGETTEGDQCDVPDGDDTDEDENGSGSNDASSGKPEGSG